MKLRKSLFQSFVILVILFLSIVCGLVCHTIGQKIDIRNHPREYEEYVTKYAGEYGVPEYILYALIKNESDFVSNLVSADGEIGLTQLSPTTFSWLLTLTKETMEPGILYDPETNIRYGAYMLSYLYTEYSRWNTVFAIMHAGVETVENWMTDSTLVDELGNLVDFPSQETAKYVDQMNKTAEIYQRLYY